MRYDSVKNVLVDEETGAEIPFTEGECKWIKLLVGCDKVHFTDNGRYLRLLGVRFDG